MENKIENIADIKKEKKYKDTNIFYVISKSKKAPYVLEEVPRIGKIEENNNVFSQSFCVADNTLVLSECISAGSDFDNENVLYFFLDLKSVDFFINQMKEEQEKLEEGDKKVYDFSKKYNLFEKKTFWIYFYRKNLRLYRYFTAKNESEFFEFIKTRKECYYPRVVASLEDIELIRKHMINIQDGTETRFNKIDSIEI